jgi:hypothetical protein
MTEVSNDDWDVAHDLALEVANATSEEDAAVWRQRLLSFLDTLETRYGPLPRLLSTRADYTRHDDPEKESLLLRAYAAAQVALDVVTLVYASHSLSKIYVEKQQEGEADRWIALLGLHLADFGDSYFVEEHLRLKNEVFVQREAKRRRW